MQPATEVTENGLTFYKVEQEDQFPDWAPREDVVNFLHYKMKPFEDPIPYIEDALDFAFGKGDGLGGYVMLTKNEDGLVGICVMLKTGMSGYIPEWILLMISVDPEQRGKGIGGKLMDKCAQESPGDIKLHVEYDNPAKRLYERKGFSSKYAEMRLTRS